MTIAYREDHDVDLEALAALLLAAGWGDRVRDHERLRKQVENAMFVVSAWDGERLVGFARALSDGVTNAYISTVVVADAYRRRGIGRAMIGRLMRDRDGLTFALHARPEVHAFYVACGFEPATGMFRRPRRF